MGRLHVLETKCNCQGLRLKGNDYKHKSRKDQRCNGMQGNPKNVISTNRYLLFSTPQGLLEDRDCSWHCWVSQEKKLPGCAAAKGVVDSRAQYGKELLLRGEPGCVWIQDKSQAWAVVVQVKLSLCPHRTKNGKSNMFI